MWVWSNDHHKMKVCKILFAKKILLIYVPLQNSLGMLRVYKKLGKNKSFGYLFFISRLADFIVLRVFLGCYIALHSISDSVWENVYFGKKWKNMSKQNTNYTVNQVKGFFMISPQKWRTIIHRLSDGKFNFVTDSKIGLLKISQSTDAELLKHSTPNN